LTINHEKFGPISGKNFCSYSCAFEFPCFVIVECTHVMEVSIASNFKVQFLLSRIDMWVVRSSETLEWSSSTMWKIPKKITNWYTKV